jgi:hypothetical protein
MVEWNIMEDQPTEEEFIGYLEDAGALEWVGMDKDGERILKPNMEVLAEVYPEMYYDLLEDLNETLMGLYDKGLVEIDYDEELEAKFKLSPEAVEFLEENGYGMQ